MHRLGLCPRPSGGAYSAPAAGPLAEFKGPASKGRKDRKEGQGKEKGRGE